MNRDPKSTANLGIKPQASVDSKTVGEVSIVKVAGLVGEHFVGFGKVDPAVKTLILDVSGMTRMTSFGVRQWLKAMDALPKAVGDVYLLGAPTFFVDQLNMVLNFGGPAKVLTVMAPYTCPSCGAESGETVDVLTERSTLAKGGVPEKECSKCGGKLEFDETPESYFSFIGKYAASSIQPAAAQLLAQLGLYTAVDAEGDKPPRIIKLVHGNVTYFRIIGTVGAMFRARPFLVGAEGEVVLDLAEIDRFDPTGSREWKRLLKTLAGQVPSLTLVDINDSFLSHAADSLTLARNIAVASVLVPYFCVDCGKLTAESRSVENAQWPFHMPEQVCTVCGGTTQSALSPEALQPLQKASTAVPQPSSKLIANRKEVLSRAIADASVAQAGDSASAALASDDTILGKYQIVRRLSSGGMAEVFLAKQVGIGGFERPVALKRILRQLLESRHLAVDMFLNEAKIAGRLTHPNIVQVLDVGEEKGALFLAMEYVRGKDLRELLKKVRAAHEQFPLGDTLFVIREIAQALHHAYWSTDLSGNQLAVVHRDVSPHNVIISYDGNVKLLDFGVAMSSVTEHEQSMIAGKWAYMSPEHTANQPVDHRSDLFSLGVMAYLLVTGQMPFSGSDPREIVKKIRAGQFKPVHEVAPHVPPAIAAVVHRMLAAKPEERFQTGQEVLAALVDITRSHGLEASTTSLGALMARLFAADLAEAASPTRTDEHNVVRRLSQASIEVPPVRGMSATIPANSPVDVSVTLSRGRGDASSPSIKPPTAQVSAMPPNLAAAQNPTQKKAPSLAVSLTIAVVILAAVFAIYFLVKPT
jgi:serine/threonine protein kinase